IEAENGQHGGKGARGASARRLEDLRQIELLSEQPIGPSPPVVEIAGDDQRRAPRDRFADSIAQRLHLPASTALEKAQVNVDAMQGGQPALELQHAVQKAPAFERVRRDVQVLLSDDGKV